MALLVVAPAGAQAPPSGHPAGHVEHAGHAGPAIATVLQQPGESISAAVGEALAVLSADPATDWSRVDLDALVAHLRQMDRLFSGAEVEREDLPLGARFRVRGDAATLAAARAMVPAHAAMTRSETGWTAEIEDAGDTLLVSVHGDTAEDAVKIRAVGFFGWMASGDHHRRHHLMIAAGGGHP